MINLAAISGWDGLRHLLQRNASCSTWGDPKTALAREPPQSSGLPQRNGSPRPCCFTSLDTAETVALRHGSPTQLFHPITMGNFTGMFKLNLELFDRCFADYWLRCCFVAAIVRDFQKIK